MSALTDRIAAEHRIVHLDSIQNVERLACEGCDWRATVLDGDKARRTHVAEVTEAAVREQVARDIEYAESMSRASLIERPKIGPGEFLNDWQWAAKIARGGAA